MCVILFRDWGYVVYAVVSEPIRKINVTNLTKLQVRLLSGSSLFLLLSVTFWLSAPLSKSWLHSPLGWMGGFGNTLAVVMLAKFFIKG